ncbi:hypothetical protein IWQ60_002271 [Tieghemiomyces parasiticus]|uniref:ESCRT-II complex subunit VPS25 n=1 Tax=Tieghemiomyces parasiticus TaxID=78921 RepID=A0A9W8AJB1_9FUNG|nr:hypothetical protein IWQ60_002271 [Tieghemiomyces parasiticus]
MVDQKQATWETDDKRSAPIQCLVYWHKPEEWAQLIYDWVQDNGLSNSVYTLYELAHDDATKGTAFYDIDYQVLRNALDVLVVRGKAQLFESDASPGNPGVKFF